MAALPISSIMQGGYSNPLTRELQCERPLTKSMLQYPIFISDDADAEEIIPGFPGQKRWGVNRLQEFLGPLVEKGLRSVILFGVLFSLKKDSVGTHADTDESPVVQAIKVIRRLFPDLVVAADVCMCEYTDHGHCGILDEDGTINNAKSVERMANIALKYAEAGAHMVAPSDMTVGRIRVIKQGLIEKGYGNKCLLMSYAAKFASCQYGPFREAAGSAPSFGNRKCYQFDPRSRGPANRAILRDVNEGADIIMVKPASEYLDIVAEARILAPNHPRACYQVSGEFVGIHAGVAMGCYDLKTRVFESLNCMIRAGATLILTYFTPELLEWLDE